jgi:hypothetical protein
MSRGSKLPSACAWKHTGLDIYRGVAKIAFRRASLLEHAHDACAIRTMLSAWAGGKRNQNPTLMLPVPHVNQTRHPLLACRGTVSGPGPCRREERPHGKQNQESAEMPTTLRVIRVNLAPTSHGSIIWHVENGNTANRQSNARASGVAKIGKHRAPPITSPMSLALCRSH